MVGLTSKLVPGVQLSIVMLLLSMSAAGSIPTNIQSPKCSIALPGSSGSKLNESTVINVSDGTHPRCVSAVIPENNMNGKKLPILFDFHGSGGNASNFPGSRAGQTGLSWADLAVSQQFAVIGGEALQFGGSGPTPPTPSPVSKKCLQCFADAGCKSGNNCEGCCKRNQGKCASSCMPAPFEKAVDAVCGKSEDEFAFGVESSWHGGQWLLPEIQNDTTDLVCDWENNLDLRYINATLTALESYKDKDGKEVFDTERIFITGCSMGSAFTVWMSQCLHEKMPSRVTAFASQSTGLKVKGDGLNFPTDNYNPQYGWGECPTCKYFPAPVKKTEGLKACITDQTEDPSSNNPYFYKSSLALEAAWKKAGMATNSTYHPGAHCATYSFDWITECLDDGTGRLIHKDEEVLFLGQDA